MDYKMNGSTTDSNTPSIFDSLTNKYFHFLCLDHGFVYREERGFFDAPKIRIRLEQIDYVTPSIKIWFKSEPKFTEMDLAWILWDSIDHEAIDKNLLEDNFAYFSNLLRQQMSELTEHSEQFLLKGIKRVFIHGCKIEKIALESVPTNLNFRRDSNLRKYYNYIKKKDRGWDPVKDV